MKTLIFYHNGDGLARAAVADHSEEFDTADRDTIVDKIEPRLPDYNEGGGLFFYSLDPADEISTPTDEWGDEVPVARITLE